MRLLLPLTLALLLSACASDVPRRPAALTPISTASLSVQSFTLAQRVGLASAAGYYSEMRAGSRWVNVGSIAEGEVFRPENSVFQVEGRHVHEAYVVIHDGKVVGFYLPVEKSFSPLTEAVPLSAKL
jgi:hypothetical protein